MKKGIQYSHYCGTELLELNSSIRLAIDSDKDMSKESKEWLEYAIQMVNKLRKKISDLDNLNEMSY